MGRRFVGKGARNDCKRDDQDTPNKENRGSMAQDIRASRPLQQCKKQVASYNFACAVLRSSGFFPASQSLKKNKTSCQLHRRSSPMPAKIGWHGECHPYVARRLGLGSSSMKQGPMIEASNANQGAHVFWLRRTFLGEAGISSQVLQKHSFCATTTCSRTSMLKLLKRSSTVDPTLLRRNLASRCGTRSGAKGSTGECSIDLTESNGLPVRLS